MLEARDCAARFSSPLTPQAAPHALQTPPLPTSLSPRFGFEPHDFLTRLVAAVPPLRFHLLRDFGVLSSHSSLCHWAPPPIFRT
ncbi:MAG: hypothetical protein DRI90_18615 [Deltaproteobacteria bacterium]|nr:MAG: hypothetical protein DRI90_18615 [Deltaproteobacteria bacterium]